MKGSVELRKSGSWRVPLLANTALAIGLITGACATKAREALEPPPSDAAAEAAAPDAGMPDVEPEDGGRTDDATLPPRVDSDGDGFFDDEEVCDLVADVPNAAGQPLNTDGDAFPNACDVCPTNPTDDGIDTDRDGRGNVCDGAPLVPDDGADADNDSVPNIIDNCDQPNPPPAFGQPQIDGDSDGSGQPCDCNDSNYEINPGADDDPCDGEDTDCDGEGDLIGVNGDGTSVINGEPQCECLPGTERTIGSGVGICVSEEQECQFNITGGTQFVTTNAGEVIEPGSEGTICDVADNDCDGLVDEGLSCTPPLACTVGDTRPCGQTDEGPCQFGTQTCVSPGVWGSTCTGEVAPAASDTCGDNIDNDCDGVVDNQTRNADGTPIACTGITGDCATREGQLECATGLPGGVRCSVDPAGSEFIAAAEICDGRDNDCDGAVDEVPVSVVGGSSGATGVMGTACSLPGVCGAGVFRCAGPGAVDCTSVERRVGNPAEQEDPLCDGADNDCDGTTDEGCECEIDITRSCGTDDGECNQGSQTCGPDGRWPATCGGAEFVGPTPENCGNGLDEDCDGRVDEPVGNDCLRLDDDGDNIEEGRFVCGPDGTPVCAED